MPNLIFNYVSDVVCSKFSVTEEEVLSHIGTIIGNAKDWGVHRKGRQQ